MSIPTRRGETFLGKWRDLAVFLLALVPVHSPSSRMAFLPPQRARLQATLAWVGTLVLWWRIGGILPAMAAGVTGSLALLAWVSPPHFAPIQRALDRVLHALLAGLTWSSLALIYLVVFTPLRGWRALTGRDSLQLRPDPAVITYLQPLPPARPDRFDRQF